MREETKVSPAGRVRAIGGRIFYDGRLMAILEGERRQRAFAPREPQVWDDGLRVEAETLHLPEGTRALDFETERETQTLIQQAQPQLLIYPHGRFARVWREEDGALVMVFGDSPKALLNNSITLDCLRLPLSAIEKTELAAAENRMRMQAPEIARLEVENNFSNKRPERIRRWLRDVFILGRAERAEGGTPTAWRATAALIGGETRWLRAEVDQFAMGVRSDESGIWLAGVTVAPRVWTLRLQDILPEGFFRLTLWRDGLAVDGESNQNREVEEFFEGVTRDDKPALEMLANGGFVARLEPCHETEFRMTKGGRE